MAYIKRVVEAQLNLIDLSEAPRLERGGDPLAALEDLMASIKRVGQLHPVIVYEIPEERYRLVSGYRRVVALTKLRAPFAWIAVLNEPLTREQALAVWLNENMIREDVPATNLREMLLTLYKQVGSVSELSKITGLSERKLASYFR